MERNLKINSSDKFSTIKQQKAEDGSAGKNKNHRVELDNHRLLSVSEVRGVPVFNDKEIKIILDGESLTVTGQNLEIKLLDLEGGRLLVDGYVVGLKYSSSGSDLGLLKRIFK